MLLAVKNPSFVQLLGPGLLLGLAKCCCLSEAVVISESRGIVVQKALLQPVPILKNQKIIAKAYSSQYVYIQIQPKLNLLYLMVDMMTMKKIR